MSWKSTVLNKIIKTKSSDAYQQDPFFQRLLVVSSMKRQDSEDKTRTLVNKLQGGGGYSRFQVTGMIEWGQKSNPKKSLGLPTKPQKIPGPEP